MNKEKIVNVVGILGIILVVIVLVTHNKEGEKGLVQNGYHTFHMMSDGSMMRDDEMQNMHENMKITTDREFLLAMIPHHEEAISTAKEVLERGGSFPEIKTLAENIISSQAAEVEKMKIWYKEWTGEDYVSDGKYEPMMRDLTNLSGGELDKVFLEDMIVHHMGAIMMADQAKASQRQEIIDLSNAIINAQKIEIDQMKNWLASKF